jgi:hypothetical protein
MQSLTSASARERAHAPRHQRLALWPSRVGDSERHTAAWPRPRSGVTTVVDAQRRAPTPSDSGWSAPAQLDDAGRVAVGCDHEPTFDEAVLPRPLPQELHEDRRDGRTGVPRRKWKVQPSISRTPR